MTRTAASSIRRRIRPARPAAGTGRGSRQWTKGPAGSRRRSRPPVTRGPDPGRPPGGRLTAEEAGPSGARSGSEEEFQMRRRTFDALATTAGLLIAGLLLVAGGLLTWGHNFVTSEVHTQLAAQKIVFPPASSDAVKGPQFAPMRQYGGQLMTTGAQAQVYADDFIAVHLSGDRRRPDLRPAVGQGPGQPQGCGAGRPGADHVPRRDPARPAAERLCLRDHRPDHALGRDRRLHRRRACC